MTTLLSSDSATNSGATEGNVKTFLTNIREFIASALGTNSTDKGSMLVSLGALLNGKVDKSGAYTVVEEDRGQVINCTGSTNFTINLAPAATLGDGFAFAVVNSGTAVVTIDPNMSEQVNGATTYVIKPTETLIFYCDGTRFLLFGKAPASLVTSFNGQSGDVVVDLSPAALGAAASGHTHSYYAGLDALVSATKIDISYYDPIYGTYSSVPAIRYTRANGTTFDVRTT